jgi:hypothetical protein
MKLSTLHTAQVARQLDSWVVPETHPANLSLCETFGEHTFFLDSEGLVIAEPSAADEDTDLARVVKLATWADEARTELAPQPREDTGQLVVLSEAA